MKKKTVMTVLFFAVAAIFLLCFIHNGAAADIKVYPNPFKAKLGHTDITFENATASSTLRIYSVTGKLVWERANIGIKHSWPTDNMSSQKVASGIYFYVITDGSAVTARGKIAVVR